MAKIHIAKGGAPCYNGIEHGMRGEEHALFGCGSRDFFGEGAGGGRGRRRGQDGLAHVSAVLPPSRLVGAESRGLVGGHCRLPPGASFAGGQEPGSRPGRRRTDARLGGAGRGGSGDSPGHSLERRPHRRGNPAAQRALREGKASLPGGQHRLRRVHGAKAFVDAPPRAGTLCKNQENHAAQGLSGLPPHRRAQL